MEGLEKIPLSKRKLDIIFIMFFLFALPVVYIIDLEQVTVPDYKEFKLTKKYPSFPPPFMVDVKKTIKIDCPLVG
jgi:hypothetical protein